MDSWILFYLGDYNLLLSLVILLLRSFRVWPFHTGASVLLTRPASAQLLVFCHDETLWTYLPLSWVFFDPGLALASFSQDPWFLIIHSLTFIRSVTPWGGGYCPLLCRRGFQGFSESLPEVPELVRGRAKIWTLTKISHLWVLVHKITPPFHKLGG